jgi:hypothetical protein
MEIQDQHLVVVSSLYLLWTFIIYLDIFCDFKRLSGCLVENDD